MARCTAPVYGHRSSAAAEDCPACRGRWGSRRSYTPYTAPVPAYSPPVSAGVARSSGWAGGGTRPKWSRANSTVAYTPGEVRALTPVRESIEKRTPAPDCRDVFLCHAWDDRKGAAKELHDLLESLNVSVWFSEKDVALGSSLLREIDKGLAKSRVGIVLVTPALLRRVQALASSGVARSKGAAAGVESKPSRRAEDQASAGSAGCLAGEALAPLGPLNRSWLRRSKPASTASSPRSTGQP